LSNKSNRRAKIQRTKYTKKKIDRAMKGVYLGIPYPEITGVKQNRHQRRTNVKYLKKKLGDLSFIMKAHTSVE
jgi:hypothetical protein